MLKRYQPRSGYFKRRRSALVPNTTSPQAHKVPFGCNVCNFSSYSIRKYVLHVKDKHYTPRSVSSDASSKKDKDSETAEAQPVDENNGVANGSEVHEDACHLSKNASELVDSDGKDKETTEAASFKEDLDADTDSKLVIDLPKDDELPAVDKTKNDEEIRKVANSDEMQSTVESGISNSEKITLEMEQKSLSDESPKNFSSIGLDESKEQSADSSNEAKDENKEVKKSDLNSSNNESEILHQSGAKSNDKENGVKSKASQSESTLTFSKDKVSPPKSKGFSKLEDIVHNLKDHLSSQSNNSSDRSNTSLSPVTDLKNNMTEATKTAASDLINAPTLSISTVTSTTVVPSAKEVLDAHQNRRTSLPENSLVRHTTPPGGGFQKHRPPAPRSVPCPSETPNVLNYNTICDPRELFSALAERGIVSFPNMRIISYIDSNPKIRSVLLHSFSKFPYPPVEEVCYLSSVTKLSVPQIKNWFVGARIKFGISWSPDEVMEAWSFVGGQPVNNASQPIRSSPNVPAPNIHNSMQKPAQVIINEPVPVGFPINPCSTVWMTCNCGLEHELNASQIGMLNNMGDNISTMPGNQVLQNAQRITGLPLCAVESFFQGKCEINNKQGTKAIAKAPKRKSLKRSRKNSMNLSAGTSSSSTNASDVLIVPLTDQAFPNPPPSQDGLDVLFESFCIEPYPEENEIQRIKMATGMGKSAIRDYFLAKRREMQERLKFTSAKPHQIAVYENYASWTKDLVMSRSVHQQTLNVCLQLK